MAKYRKVEVRMWTDEKITKLSSDAKYVWLYCLTATDSNMIGLYSFRRMVAIEDTGMDAARFDAAFAEVIASGLAVFDPESRLIFIPGFLKVNPPQSINHAKGMASVISELPKTKLFHQLMERVRGLSDESAGIWDIIANALLQRLGEAASMPNASHTEGIPKASRRHANTGTGTGTGTEDKAGTEEEGNAAGAAGLSAESVIDLYHSVLSTLPPFRMGKNTEGYSEMRKSIRARSKGNGMDTLDAWRNYFTMVAHRGFLMGRNDRGWTADLPWLVGKKNMAKVLSGQYANKSDKPSKSMADRMAGINGRAGDMARDVQ